MTAPPTSAQQAANRAAAARAAAERDAQTQAANRGSTTARSSTTQAAASVKSSTPSSTAGRPSAADQGKSGSYKTTSSPTRSLTETLSSVSKGKGDSEVPTKPTVSPTGVKTQDRMSQYAAPAAQTGMQAFESLQKLVNPTRTLSQIVAGEPAPRPLGPTQTINVPRSLGAGIKPATTTITSPSMGSPTFNDALNGEVINRLGLNLGKQFTDRVPSANTPAARPDIAGGGDFYRATDFARREIAAAAAQKAAQEQQLGAALSQIDSAGRYNGPAPAAPSVSPAAREPAPYDRAITVADVPAVPTRGQTQPKGTSYTAQDYKMAGYGAYNNPNATGNLVNGQGQIVGNLKPATAIKDIIGNPASAPQTADAQPPASTPRAPTNIFKLKDDLMRLGLSPSLGNVDKLVNPASYNPVSGPETMPDPGQPELTRGIPAPAGGDTRVQVTQEQMVQQHMDELQKLMEQKGIVPPSNPQQTQQPSAGGGIYTTDTIKVPAPVKELYKKGNTLKTVHAGAGNLIETTRRALGFEPTTPYNVGTAPDGNVKDQSNYQSEKNHSSQTKGPAGQMTDAERQQYLSLSKSDRNILDGYLRSGLTFAQAWEKLKGGTVTPNIPNPPVWEQPQFPVTPTANMQNAPAPIVTALTPLMQQIAQRLFG